MLKTSQTQTYHMHNSVTLYQLSSPIRYSIYEQSPEVEKHSFPKKIVPNSSVLQKNKWNKSIFVVYKSVLLISPIMTTRGKMTTTTDLTWPEWVVVFAQQLFLDAPGQPGVRVSHSAGIQRDKFLLVLLIVAAGLPLAPAEAADHGVGGQAVHIGDHCEMLLPRMSLLSPMARLEPKGVACSSPLNGRIQVTAEEQIFSSSAIRQAKLFCYAENCFKHDSVSSSKKGKF